MGTRKLGLFPMMKLHTLVNLYCSKRLKCLEPPYFSFILDLDGERAPKIPYFHMAMYIQ